MENHSLSHDVMASYLCECGALFKARRWAWIDVVLDGARAARVRDEGPFEGRCPTCGEPASGQAPWVACDEEAECAWLVLPAERRGEVMEALRWHHTLMEACEGALPGWLLSPWPRADLERGGLSPWERGGHSGTYVGVAGRDYANAGDGAVGAGVPVQVGGELSGVTQEGELSSHVGLVVLSEGSHVSLHVTMDDEDRAHWGTAALSVRPVHLRELGYPILGVRVLASYLGRVSVIDGVVDPASEQAAGIVERLCEEVSVRVEIEGESPGAASVVRGVSAPGLQRNAALCFESARAVLAAGNYAPLAWEDAVEELAARTVPERLQPAAVQIGAGDYQYIISATESWGALEHLEAVSSTANLAHLLEVDGMPVGEFEQLRHRILAHSIVFGICSPRRFWRRVIASGLCESPAAYVSALVEARCVTTLDADAREGLALDAAAETESWRRLLAFCEARGLEAPDEVYQALGEGRPAAASSPKAVAGVLGEQNASFHVVSGLRDRTRRVQIASDLLLGYDERDVKVLVEHLDAFSDDELIRLLPPMVVATSAHRSALLEGLDAENSSLRQSVVLAFGEAGSPSAAPAICGMLFEDPSAAWRDAAKALGQIGPSAVEEVARRVTATTPKHTGERAALAFREAGQRHGVELIADLCAHEHTLVRAAASTALATLGEESEPLDPSDPVSRFSQRARLRLASTEGMKVAPDPTQVLTISDLEII